MNTGRPGPLDAETIAIQALGFLAGDMERLDRFLALTGLSPAGVREAAGEPGFLAAVLEHVSSDEALLMTFAANAGIEPQAVTRARLALVNAGRAAKDGHDW